MEKKGPFKECPGTRTNIYGFPGFGSKDLSNPKDDETKNDAMVNVYPLECPKLFILLKTIDKSMKSVETDDGPGGQ